MPDFSLLSIILALSQSCISHLGCNRGLGLVCPHKKTVPSLNTLDLRDT